MISKYQGRVTIDLGAGDGLFMWRSARRNPDRFYVGIDSNPTALRRISSRALRKPTKGGLPNALFVQAAAEDLPFELDGIADELYVLFPWGSLLRGVAGQDRRLLSNLRRLCVAGARLEVVMALEPARDRAEIERLGLKPLTTDFLLDSAIPAYRAAGFDAVFEVIDGAEAWPALFRDLWTSWAGRLRQSRRPLIRIAGVAQTSAVW